MICRRERAGGRPEWATLHGGRVNVRVHDAWYLRECARLKVAALSVHPDAGGTARKFDTAMKLWNTFRKAQRTHYKALGVSVPKGRP